MRYVSTSTVCGLLVAFCFVAIANAQPKEEWVARWENSGHDQAWDIAVDLQGNAYVTGEGDIGSIDYVTIKYDTDGKEQWVAMYNGTGGGTDQAYAVAIDDMGNVYVTGRSRGSGNDDVATIKYGSTGTEQWVARYNGPANGTDVGNDIAVDASGDVYVTGESAGVGTSSDFVTIKYSSDGAELWVARFNEPGTSSDVAIGLVLTDDGGIVATGGTLARDCVTVKYDSDGSQQWVSRYHGNGWSEPVGIGADDDGNIFIAGQAPGVDSDFLTIKYDPDGIEQWVRKYNGPGNNQDEGDAIAVDESGNVIVSGFSRGVGFSSDLATVKYDGQGQQQWAARYSGYQTGIDVAADDGGNVYVTGSNSGSDWITIGYDSDGVVTGLAVYDGPGHNYDQGTALAIGNDGRVLATGYSTGASTGYDFGTIKYTFVPCTLPASPTLLLPLNGSGNHGMNVSLSWEPEFCASMYSLQLGSDSTFGSVLVDEDSLLLSTYPVSDLSVNDTLFWRVSATNDQGTSPWSQTWSFRTMVVDVAESSIEIPDEFELLQNYPNPFNSISNFGFRISNLSDVNLKIYDLLGREVATIVDERLAPGVYSRQWDAAGGVASGVYVYRIEAGGDSHTRKLALVK